MKKVVLFALLIGSVRFALAQDVVLKAVSGPVVIGSTSKAALEGQSIALHDHVYVGAGGIAHVVFPNGDAVLVKENSSFVLDKDKKGELISFDKGEFLVGLPEKRKADKAFRVKTPAAMLASTQGAFWGKSDESKAVSCACFSGSLNVLAVEKSVALKANQTIQLAFGAANPGIPQVSKIDPIYVNTFAIKGSLQNVDTVIKAGK